MGVWQQHKLNFQRIGVIILCWMLADLFFQFHEQAILAEDGWQEMNWCFPFLGERLALDGLGGLIGGSLLVYVNTYCFRKRSHAHSLILTMVGYSLGFVLLIVVWEAVFAQADNTPALVARRVVENLTGPEALQTLDRYLVWFFVYLFTLFFLQVCDKFGPGNLWRFLIGEFHSPRQVDRIFMFLDMKASTRIAERLGHHQYFNLLRHCFAEMTGPVTRFGGEIYQYLGDGIIISWPMSRGFKQWRCIHCFFAIRQQFRRRGSFFHRQFGILPVFKAGLHCGAVTAGELGQLKTEIVFSGAVLNTTARIQDQCNALGADFLISEQACGHLSDAGDYAFIPKDAVVLQGRRDKIRLFAVAEADRERDLV